MIAKKYSKDALEAVARRLSSRSDLSERVLKVEKPLMVTTLNRRDQYRKEGLLGGEQFKFTSVYAGKSGKLIFCFRPIRPADYKRIEAGASELEKLFPSFLDDVESFLETDLDTYLESYSEVYEEKEREEQMAQNRAKYGSSWGMF